MSNANDVVKSFVVQKGDDEIRVNVLRDGRAQIETDEISPMNHKKADELLKFFKGIVGGDVEIVKRKATHTHNHQGQKISHSH